MDLGSRLGWGGSSAGFRSSTVEAGDHGDSRRRLWHRLQPPRFYSRSWRHTCPDQSRLPPAAPSPAPSGGGGWAWGSTLLGGGGGEA